MTTKREETIELAVRFLKDPKVQSSTLAKRISFLESKGLTAEEIEEAVNRSNASGDSTPKPATTAAPTSTTMTPAVSTQQYQQQGPPLPPGGPSPQGYGTYNPNQPYMGQPMYGQPMYGQMMPAPQQPTTWKDYTLGVIGVAAVGYGLFEIGKRYVAPYIAWPSEAKLAADQKRIEEQLSAATEAVKEARDGAELVMKDVEAHSTKIGSALDNLRGLVKDIQDSDFKRDAEIKAIKDDVDSIREMIPKIIDKAKDAQNSAMVDLHNEVKSLKNLFLNRRIGPAPIPQPHVMPPASVAASPAPTPISSSSAADDDTTSTPRGYGGPSATPGLGGVGVSKALPFGKPIGIPSWQLASTSSSPPAAAASTTPPPPASLVADEAAEAS
ncbi:peroxisomal membrane protein pex14 [Dinochytrium kinnereticum]|nr:peroxisomal membrane protein pex14 [Dinochytrium kinnereticum]